MTGDHTQYWFNRTAFLGIDTMGRYNFPSISPEAAQFLVGERSIYGIGVDTASLDPLEPNPAHRIFHAADVYILENLRNLHRVPHIGARAVIMPMKIKGSSAAPARVVAVFL